MLDSTVGKPGKYGRGRGAIATPSLENLPRLVWLILLLPSIANNAEKIRGDIGTTGTSTCTTGSRITKSGRWYNVMMLLKWAAMCRAGEGCLPSIGKQR